ncbi:metallophosphoesterase [Myxococcota bacterium]|nr:metallophosphoesterase [Myxococcota bacterium]
MRQRIFVGDVQGCAEELGLLVDRANACFGDDFELWVAGDVVNRGPDNRRALELVRGFVESGRGRYVLGNHEIHLLLVAFGLRELARTDSIGDVLGAPDAAEWIDWLRSRPLVEAGELAGQPFAMVHASSHPDWSLARLCEVGEAVRAQLSGERDRARAFLALSADADPLRDALGRLTRCRSVTTQDVWSSADPVAPARPWHAAWSERHHDFGLVYGHWARQGLHAGPGLRGLDTGCVHHGRGRDGSLTAWVPDEQPASDGRRAFDVPDERFWHIPALRRYYYPEAGERPD